MFKADVKEEPYENQRPKWFLKGQKPPVNLWAQHFSLPEKRRNPLFVRLFNKELSVMKVYYPFLENSQIHGRVYKKFGIPHVCGEISKQFIQDFGKKSSIKRSRRKEKCLADMKFVFGGKPQIEVKTERHNLFDSVKDSWKVEKYYDNIEDNQLDYCPYASKPRKTTPCKRPYPMEDTFDRAENRLLDQFLIFEDDLDSQKTSVKREISSAQKHVGGFELSKTLVDVLKQNSLELKENESRETQFNKLNSVQNYIKSSLRSSSIKKSNSVKKKVQFTNVDVFHSAESDSICNGSDDELAFPLRDDLNIKSSAAGIKKNDKLKIKTKDPIVVTPQVDVDIEDVQLSKAKNTITVHAMVHQSESNDDTIRPKSVGVLKPDSSKVKNNFTSASINLDAIQECTDKGYDSDYEDAMSDIQSVSDEENIKKNSFLNNSTNKRKELCDHEENAQNIDKFPKHVEPNTVNNSINDERDEVLDIFEGNGIVELNHNDRCDVNKLNVPEEPEKIISELSVGNCIERQGLLIGQDELCSPSNNTVTNDLLEEVTKRNVAACIRSQTPERKLFTPEKNPEAPLNIDTFSEETPSATPVNDENLNDFALKKIQDFLAVSEMSSKNIYEALAGPKDVEVNNLNTSVPLHDVSTKNVPVPEEECYPDSMDSEMSCDEILTSQPTKSYNVTETKSSLMESIQLSKKNLSVLQNKHEEKSELNNATTNSVHESSLKLSDSDKENKIIKEVDTMASRTGVRRTLKFDDLSDSSICSVDIPQFQSRILIDHGSDSDGLSFTNNINESELSICGVDVKHSPSRNKTEIKDSLKKGAEERFAKEKERDSDDVVHQQELSVEKVIAVENVTGSQKKSTSSFDRDLTSSSQVKNKERNVNLEEQKVVEERDHLTIETCTTKEVEDISPQVSFGDKICSNNVSRLLSQKTRIDPPQISLNRTLSNDPETRDVMDVENAEGRVEAGDNNHLSDDQDGDEGICSEKSGNSSDIVVSSQTKPQQSMACEKFSLLSQKSSQRLLKTPTCRTGLPQIMSNINISTTQTSDKVDLSQGKILIRNVTSADNSKCNSNVIVRPLQVTSEQLLSQKSIEVTVNSSLDENFGDLHSKADKIIPCDDDVTPSISNKDSKHSSDDVIQPTQPVSQMYNTLNISQQSSRGQLDNKLYTHKLVKKNISDEQSKISGSSYRSAPKISKLRETGDNNVIISESLSPTVTGAKVSVTNKLLITSRDSYSLNCTTPSNVIFSNQSYLKEKTLSIEKDLEDESVDRGGSIGTSLDKNNDKHVTNAIDLNDDLSVNKASIQVGKCTTAKEAEGIVAENVKKSSQLSFGDNKDDSFDKTGLSYSGNCENQFQGQEKNIETNVLQSMKSSVKENQDESKSYIGEEFSNVSEARGKDEGSGLVKHNIQVREAVFDPNESYFRKSARGLSNRRSSKSNDLLDSFLEDASYYNQAYANRKSSLIEDWNALSFSDEDSFASEKGNSCINSDQDILERNSFLELNKKDNMSWVKEAVIDPSERNLNKSKTCHSRKIYIDNTILDVILSDSSLSDVCLSIAKGKSHSSMGESKLNVCKELLMKSSSTGAETITKHNKEDIIDPSCVTAKKSMNSSAKVHSKLDENNDRDLLIESKSKSGNVGKNTEVSKHSPTKSNILNLNRGGQTDNLETNKGETRWAKEAVVDPNENTCDRHSLRNVSLLSIGFESDDEEMDVEVHRSSSKPDDLNKQSKVIKDRFTSLAKPSVTNLNQENLGEVANYRMKEAVIDPNKTSSKNYTAKSLLDICFDDIENNEEGYLELPETSSILKRVNKSMKIAEDSFASVVNSESTKLNDSNIDKQCVYDIIPYKNDSNETSLVSKNQSKVSITDRLKLGSSVPKKHIASGESSNESGLFLNTSFNDWVPVQKRKSSSKEERSPLEESDISYERLLPVKRSRKEEPEDDIKRQKTILSKYFKESLQSPTKNPKVQTQPSKQSGGTCTVMKVKTNPIQMATGEDASSSNKKEKSKPIGNITDFLLAENISPNDLESLESERADFFISPSKTVIEGFQSPLRYYYKNVNNNSLFTSIKDFNFDDIDKPISDEDLGHYLSNEYKVDEDDPVEDGKLSDFDEKIDVVKNDDTFVKQDEEVDDSKLNSTEQIYSIHDDILMTSNSSPSSSMMSYDKMIKELKSGSVVDTSTSKNKTLNKSLNNTSDVSKYLDSSETNSLIQLKDNIECLKFINDSQLAKYNIPVLNRNSNNTSTSDDKIQNISHESSSSLKSKLSGAVKKVISPISSLFTEKTEEFQAPCDKITKKRSASALESSVDVILKQYKLDHVSDSDSSLGDSIFKLSDDVEQCQSDLTSNEGDTSSSGQQKASDSLMSPASQGLMLSSPPSSLSTEYNGVSNAQNDVESSPINRWAIIANDPSPPDFQPDDYYD